MTHCPICQNSHIEHYLDLPNSPIYQHPVKADVKIPLPYAVNLTYLWCPCCGHSFQATYNQQLLERIYANHYYTPADAEIGTTFRDQFFESCSALIDELKKLGAPKILEIGSSSGEVLAQFKAQLPSATILGFEPNAETAAAARERLVPTRVEFFDAVAAATLPPCDLIISRHVIEHISAFDSFFRGIEIASHSQTWLLLETPSLDFSEQQASIAPFHIEHLHVFSSCSLAALGRRYGWHVQAATTTDSGNLVMLFARTAGIPAALPPKNTRAVAGFISQFKERIQSECAGKKPILWGAGPGGRTILALAELQPERLVDGNRNKAGKRFCDITLPVEYGPEVIAELISTGLDIEYVIIIGSTFYAEIRATLIQFNWRGAVISPYEWQLRGSI